MKSYFFLTLLLFCGVTGFCQSHKGIKKAVITLGEVNVVGKRISQPFVFSTFTKSPFKTSSVFYDKSFFYPHRVSNLGIAVKVIASDSDVYMRIDSVYIKGKRLDTSDVKLYFRVYQNGKLYDASSAKLIHAGKKIFKFNLSKSFLLP